MENPEQDWQEPQESLLRLEGPSSQALVGDRSLVPKKGTDQRHGRLKDLDKQGRMKDSGQGRRQQPSTLPPGPELWP